MLFPATAPLRQLDRCLAVLYGDMSSALIDSVSSLDSRCRPSSMRSSRRSSQALPSPASRHAPTRELSPMSSTICRPPASARARAHRVRPSRCITLRSVWPVIQVRGAGHRHPRSRFRASTTQPHSADSPTSAIRHYEPSPRDFDDPARLRAARSSTRLPRPGPGPSTPCFAFLRPIPACECTPRHNTSQDCPPHAILACAALFKIRELDFNTHS